MLARSSPRAEDEKHRPQEAEPQPDADRLAAFGEALDALLAEVKSKLGDEDVAYIERLDRFSKKMEWLGRALIQLSFEPIGFFGGVVALAIHKQLVIELGHMMIHGTFDRLPVDERFHSTHHRWDHPVSEAGWRLQHNFLHHGHTGVVGKDPDVDWGTWRTVDSIEHRVHHWVQVPLLLLVVVPNTWFVINGHVTGLAEAYTGRARVLRDRSRSSILGAHRLALSAYARYIAKEYLFWPVLAGPLFPKVALGNFLAGTLRDLWSGAVNLSAHTGDPVKTFENVGPPKGHGEFYRRQVEGTRNITVPPIASFVDAATSFPSLHIEHHLFPKLPYSRLREIAPRVRAICEEHGIRYTAQPLGDAVASMLRTYLRLSIKPRAARSRRAVDTTADSGQLA